MNEYGNAVHRNRWSIAGAAGLVAFLLFWLAIGWSFPGGLFAGLVVFGILLVVIGLIGADSPAGDAAEGGRTEGDRTVPPSVSAGAGGAGGAAASAASPVAANRSEGGTAHAPDDRVEDRTADDRPDDLNDIAITPGEINPTSAREPDLAVAEPGAETRVGNADDPARAGMADPVPGSQISESPTSDAAISDTSISDAPAPEAPLPDENLRDPGAVPPTDLTDEDADAATEASEPGDVMGAGNVRSKPPTLPAPRTGQPDDLRRIRGIGPKLAALCNSLGFWHFDQIAGWSEAEIDWVDAHLDGFKGRVRRDDWVAQARALASGETSSEFPDGVDRGGVR